MRFKTSGNLIREYTVLLIDCICLDVVSMHAQLTFIHLLQKEFLELKENPYSGDSPSMQGDFPGDSPGV